MISAYRRKSTEHTGVKYLLDVFVFFLCGVVIPRGSINNEYSDTRKTAGPRSVVGTVEEDSSIGGDRNLCLLVRMCIISVSLCVCVCSCVSVLMYSCICVCLSVRMLIMSVSAYVCV